MTAMTATSGFTCPNCGSTSFEEGFIDDVLNGRVRWLRGAMEIGFLGNAKRSGQQRMILAWRCTTCSRLELYAGDET